MAGLGKMYGTMESIQAGVLRRHAPSLRERYYGDQHHAEHRRDRKMLSVLGDTW